MLSGREKAAKFGEKPEKRCFQTREWRLNWKKARKKMFSVREKAAKSGTIFSKSFLRPSSPPKIRETAVSQRHAFSAGHSGTQTTPHLQRKSESLTLRNTPGFSPSSQTAPHGRGTGNHSARSRRSRRPSSPDWRNGPSPARHPPWTDRNTY